jgi:hypothetical protein
MAMETSVRTVTTPVEIRTDFVHWTPVIAGALVAAALSLLLIAFGASLGLGVSSTAPTWRDTSRTLALVVWAVPCTYRASELWLRRLHGRPSAQDLGAGLHSEFREFRDGSHGLLSWALAVVLSGLIAAAVAATISSKAVPPATTQTPTAGEALIAYDLDRLFRSDRRDQGNLAYQPG